MRKYFWIIIILVIGTALRYYHNLDISLWHDEAFSALLIKYPWGEMMYRIGLDVHPPMYYIFLRLWNYVYGDSLLSLRSFSVFFSVGTIWAAWLFVKEAFKNEKAALWAAVFIAINPFQIQYATEARMYTMGAFFTLLAAYFLVKALNEQKLEYQNEVQEKMPRLPDNIKLQGRSRLHFLGFIVSVIIMIYSHYYLLFAAAALCFYGVLYLHFHHQGGIWQKYRMLFLSFIGIGLSFVPWLPIFLYQYKQVGAGYWIPPMDRWSVPSTLYSLLVGFAHSVDQPNVKIYLVLITLVFVFILFKFLKQIQNFHKWLVVLVSAAPFLGSILFLALAKLTGSDSSVYLVRYFIFTGAFLLVMVSVWLSEVRPRAISIILTSCLILLNLWAFINYWQGINIQSRPGMNSAAKYLKANMEPGHKLYVGSSFEFFNLKYYVNQLLIPQTPLLFSGGNADIKNLPHFAGTAILTNEDLLPDFKRDVRSGDTVWLVWTNGFGASKPAIPTNWTQVVEKEYSEVRPYVGTNIYVDEYSVN